MSFTIANLEAKKSRYTNDPLILHLIQLAISCKLRSRAYWEMNGSLLRSAHGLSIPLLLISSATGLTSAIQLVLSTTSLQILVSIFGVSTAFMSALQKYFRYAERAEQAKHIAKRYERLAKRIQNMLVFVESSIARVEDETFTKFIHETTNSLDTLVAEAEEMIPAKYFKRITGGAAASAASMVDIEKGMGTPIKTPMECSLIDPETPESPQASPMQSSPKETPVLPYEGERGLRK